MEDYRLEQSGQEVQDILNGAAMQTDLTAENERAEQAEQTLQGNIDGEEERAKAAEKQNADDIDAIEEKIPSGASSQNKLVDQQTMNSSIATATATYRGAYNLVSDLGLTVSATEQQIAEALATKMTALSITPDNNDYCYVQVPTSDATPTQIARVDRYKYNGTAWGFEYALNNSGFTAAQWAALNSGITSGLVTKLSDLPTYTELMTLFNGIQQSIGTIEEKIPSGASAQNKLVDQQTMNSSIATATATYRGAYNLVSDLSLTVSATEQQIAAALATKMTALSITPDNNDYCYVQVPTSDATPTQIARVDRYKYNGAEWGFEYSLNNSGFTAAQWDALNSGITSGLVAKLSDLPSLSELTALLAGKQNTLTFDSTPTAGSSNPVTSNGIKQAIDAHTVVTDATPTAGSTNPVQSGGVKTYVDNKTDAQDTVIANAIAAQDDEIDRRMDQQDAEIDSRMDQQDAVISTLNGQDVIVVPSVPASGVANKIYRVYGTTSYSDYMFNAGALTTPIKIQEVNYPGVENTPTEGSQKLVSSGGVYDMMSSKIPVSIYATKDDTYTILDTSPGYAAREGCDSHLYDISGHDGDKLIITDTRYSQLEGFFMLTDAQFNRLYAFSDHNNVTITNFEHVIETGAAYLIINADSNILPTVLIEEHHTVQELVEEVNEVSDQSVILKEYLKLENTFATASGDPAKVVDAQFNNSTCYIYDVSSINGLELDIVTNATIDYWLVWFADERGYVVDSFRPSGSLFSELYRYKVVVPNGVKTAHVNCYPTNGTGTTTVTLRYDSSLFFKPSMEVLRNYDLKNLQGMKCITFGDSITWYDGIKYNWGKEQGVEAIGYQSYMRNMGLEVINKGRSGATLNFILTQEIKVADYTGIDVVTITSGANDARYLVEKGVLNQNGGPYDTTTFIGALQEAIEYILSQNNRIQIMLITPINGWIYAPEGYGVGGQTEDTMISDKYANAMIEVGAYYGIPVCDWYHNMPVNIYTRSWFMNDPEPDKSLGEENPNNLYSLHPSTLAYKLMSKMLISKINEFITRIN